MFLACRSCSITEAGYIMSPADRSFCPVIRSDSCHSLSRPAGSEAQMPITATDVKSSNPDHVGGYKVALPMFRGIESKFGLLLPRF